MTRKMAWIGSFYLIGLFSASFFDTWISIVIASSLTSFSVPALCIYGKKYVKPSVCALSAAAGLFLYSFYGIFVYGKAVEYDGCNVTVTGTIIDFADYSGDNSSYTVKGRINDGMAVKVTCFTDSSFASVGDSVSIAGKAEVFEDTYSFPAKSYYKAKGIYLQIEDVSDFSYEPCGFSLRKTIFEYRDYILGVIEDELNHEDSAIMAAMLFGDKSGIESTEKTLMYRAGIGHIMAVSGVHLSVVCSLFWFVLSCMPINKFIRFGLMMIPLVCFVMLAGMTNSVIRAAVMTVIVYSAQLFLREADTFNSLGISMILLTVFSPFTVRDASFLLSAAGVFGIGVTAPIVIKAVGEKHEIGKVMKSFIASFCTMITVFPATLLYFDEVSVISPLSNLILLPICEIILIGGVIITVTGGVSFIAVPVLKICGLCCKTVTAASEFLGNLRFSYIPLGNDFVRSAVIAVLIVAFAAFVLYKNKNHAVYFAAAILSAVIVSTNIYRYLPDGKVNVAVLKDGSAVTVVIHDKFSAEIIDLNKGGGAAKDVVKYLNRNGIYRINAMIFNTDANVSIPVFTEYSRLFDTNSLLVPEEDKALAAGFYSDKLYFYSKSSSCVESKNYKIKFLSGDVIVVECGGSEIIMYDSDSTLGKDVSCCAAVRYKGKKFDADPDALILAAMNDDSEVVQKNERKVYIGENVKFEIDDSGKVVSSVIK